jgi:hypothetical protein
MKIITWKQEDSGKIFGTAENPIINDIVPVAHSVDAVNYVGITFQDLSPFVTELTNIPDETYYFFFSPYDGYWLNEKTLKVALIKLRQTELDNLKIILNNGITLDADEISQNRLSRCVGIISDTDQIDWKDANNNFVKLSLSDIKESLLKAGQAQTALWLKYS